MAETFDGRAETLALQFQLREIDADLQELRATVTPRTSQDMRDQIFALELLRMDMQQSISAVPNPQGLTPRPPPTAFECVACNEEHPANGMITCNCGHRYCHDCAIEMVRSSLTDINLFPPQCCGAPIQLETRWSFMTAELWERVRQRKIEINVVAPTYCSNAICSRLLLPADITNSVGTCPDCDRRTCLRCKERMHQGECLGDLFGHANVTALMTDNGWQRCPNCGHGVERRDGCPHMRCRCGREFCYLCGGDWTGCGGNCPRPSVNAVRPPAIPTVAQSNEPIRLLRLTPLRQEARVVRRREIELILNHGLFRPPPNMNCGHHTRWEKLARYGVCNRCRRDEMYLYRCRACDTRACMPCRQDLKMFARNHG